MLEERLNYKLSIPNHKWVLRIPVYCMFEKPSTVLEQQYDGAPLVETRDVYM